MAYAADAVTQSLIAADIRTGVNYYIQNGGLTAVNTWLGGVVDSVILAELHVHRDLDAFRFTV